MFLRTCLVIFISVFGVANSFAQSHERRPLVAILDFGQSEIASRARDTLAANLRATFELNVIDEDQARLAARGAGYSGSLNLSLPEARSLGAAIGCDYYFLGDAQTLRRSPSTGPAYFESYASVFLISSRSGRLVRWDRPAFQAPDTKLAGDLMLKELSTSATRQRYADAIRRAMQDEREQRAVAFDNGAPVIEVAPDDEKVAEAQGVRLPRPYRRLSPAYPADAASAEAEATVDVLADLDANGEVMRVEVVRWGGFGLDEATVETVKRMHFFPAMRNGSPIPLRVLLRYNFRKPAK